jgi:MFS family permease
MLGYLALFGPLVLLPQALGASSGGELRAGLVLSALPAGFGLAAVGGEALLPATMSNRQRGAAGALTCSFALVMLGIMPLSPAWTVPLLAVAGLGLGVFVPANNAVIMRSTEQGSASVLGGLVNTARGIGTTLAITLVTLVLHLAGHSPDMRPATASAFLVLAAAAVAAAVIAAVIRPLGSASRPGRGGPQPREPGPSGAFS